MFERAVDYPTAVATYDDEGIEAAIDWCCEHLQEGDTLTVWTYQKSDLSKCAELERLVNGHSDVERITGRGGGSVRHRGPVLMAWADMDDIGRLQRFGGNRIAALCVIAGDERALRPWVSNVKATILGDESLWEGAASTLHPVVAEEMKHLTGAINHNNPITASYEKDEVVHTLLALHDAGITMDGAAMQGWAIANGWSGKNPERLAKYVQDINADKRPRSSRAPRPDYIAELRRRAAEGE